jgi:rare lipoprotein A
MRRILLLGNTVCALLLALGCHSASAERGTTGTASFYAAPPHRPDAFTAAHRSLPFGTMVNVTRLDTGAHVVVRINDRGPFIEGRIIDLSHPAAERLGMVGAGLARVRLQVVPAPVPAIRPVRYREVAPWCSPCRLPPILE